MERSDTRPGGFTLLETLVAVAVSGIVLVGLARLWATSVWTFSTQEQITEMSQNAHYTIRRLTEILSECGSNLPAVGFNVIRTSAVSDSDVTLAVNPRGGEYQFTVDDPGVTKLWIPSDLREFRYADSVVIRRATGDVFTVAIAALDTANDTLELGTSFDFKYGDAMYSYGTERFYVNGGNLYYNCEYRGTSQVLAEGIDSLSITYLDATGTATANWTDMQTVDLVVRTRTSVEDAGYDHPTYHDGYRRRTLSMSFRLRNKG